jgi:hypothetical protein
MNTPPMGWTFSSRLLSPTQNLSTSLAMTSDLEPSSTIRSFGMSPLRSEYSLVLLYKSLIFSSSSQLSALRGKEVFQGETHITMVGGMRSLESALGMTGTVG